MPVTRALSMTALAASMTVAAALLVACSSFSGGEATPTPQLDGDAPDADAPFDAADAATTTDASDASTPFCPAHPGAALCADFDGTNEPVSFHFDGFTGDVQLDPTFFTSPLHGMRAAKGATDAFLLVQTAADPALATTQRLSFDVRLVLDAAHKTNDGVFVSLGQTGPGGCTFDLESFGTTTRLDVAIPDADSGNATYDVEFLKAYPVPGRFDHVELLLTSENGAVTVNVRISGVQAIKKVVSCPGLSGSPRLRLGLMNVTGGEQFGAATYDNVLLETK